MRQTNWIGDRKMCGIVGCVGVDELVRVALSALKRLEYRGYDSAGLAVTAVPAPTEPRADTAAVEVATTTAAPSSGLAVFNALGRIRNLEARLPELTGKAVIAHTRWATHGAPSEANAHPHTSCDGTLALVHNGIIENYHTLRTQLQAEGHTFRSETDTEVLAHLIEKYATADVPLLDAVRTALGFVEGAYALAIVHAAEPDRIVVARHQSPLIIGLGTGKHYVASDVPAILEYTDKIIYLEDGDIASITPAEVRITNLAGETLDRPVQRIDFELEAAEKAGYEHFMLKEIFEQPRAIHESLLGRLSKPELVALAPSQKFTSIKIIACGTSFHAGLTARYVFESLLRIPTTVELASEYRYSGATTERPLIILITQSGETADTLAAAREANRRGCCTLAVTNIVGSSITREADHVIYTRAGLEIGVAATKTFTTQLVALYLFALGLGLKRGLITEPDADAMLTSLRKLPRYCQMVLNKRDRFKELAQMLEDAHSVFFIGRHINYPSALEGALKLKEISYIHAEGYPAGELKHGPLALLTDETPVIAIAMHDHTYEKIVSNIREVSARNSPVIALAPETDTEIEQYVDEAVTVPDTPPLFSAVPVAVALQLLAYYTARRRGCTIDMPRNLAKSVTVE